jgi:hypothetical protein
VLITLLAWGSYQLVRQLHVQREFCAHRYETAPTAADSARLDSMKYCPKRRSPSAP